MCLQLCRICGSCPIFCVFGTGKETPFLNWSASISTCTVDRVQLSHRVMFEKNPCRIARTLRRGQFEKKIPTTSQSFARAFMRLLIYYMIEKTMEGTQ